MTTPSKTWLPTKHKKLYRHKSGVYYARLTIRDKKTWRSLETATLSVALPRLKEIQENAAHLAELGDTAPASDKLTGADAITLRQQQIESDPAIKASTRRYWLEVFTALQRSWPEFTTAEIRLITAEQCQDWALKNKDRMSPTRFNNTLSALKTIFAVAVTKGARRTNPAADLTRKRVRTKDLSELLPTRQRFQEMVTTIREAGGRFSKACADLVEFLAYTGLRTGEAKSVLWQHCDFQRGEILIVGDPSQATKNGERRWIPMNKACRSLLEQIKAARGREPGTAPVMLVNEAQKAMDRAFTQLGMARLTHHDLRHYFASTCIESGVDIPTVAKWLGHKDGGALAMKVYGHLRKEHSLAAAGKVSFAP